MTIVIIIISDGSSSDAGGVIIKSAAAAAAYLHICATLAHLRYSLSERLLLCECAAAD